jgi:hypothetical protein
MEQVGYDETLVSTKLHGMKYPKKSSAAATKKKFLQNLSTDLPNCTASHARKQSSYPTILMMKARDSAETFVRIHQTTVTLVFDLIYSLLKSQKFLSVE